VRYCRLQRKVSGIGGREADVTANAKQMTGRHGFPMEVGHGPLASLALGLLLVGCAVVPGPRDDLAEKIQAHYAERAIEEGGACPQPEIASITRRKVMESAAEQTVLRVRYSYFDDSADDTPAWQRVLITDRPCTGFAERDFTLARRATGYVVTGMSGEQREEP